MDEKKHNFASEGSDKQRTDEGSHEERAAKDLEKSSHAEGAPEQLGRRQDNAGHTESSETEDKGLLDKVKDKLKGE